MSTRNEKSIVCNSESGREWTSIRYQLLQGIFKWVFLTPMCKAGIYPAKNSGIFGICWHEPSVSQCIFKWLLTGLELLKRRQQATALHSPLAIRHSKGRPNIGLNGGR